MEADTRTAPNPLSARSSPSRLAPAHAGTPAAPRQNSRRERRWLKEIRTNERFVKVAELLEAAQTVWVVWHTVDQPGLPRHVKLVQESEPKRVVTVSVSALADRRLYRRLDPAPAPVSADQRVVLGAVAERSASIESLADDDTGGRASGNEGRGAKLVPFLRSVPDPEDQPGTTPNESERVRR